MASKPTSIRGEMVAKYLRYIGTPVPQRRGGLLVDEGLRVNLHVLGKRDMRRLKEWERGQDLSVLQLDKYFTAMELHVDLFFGWCDAEGIEPWVSHPPAWWVKAAA